MNRQNEAVSRAAESTDAPPGLCLRPEVLFCVRPGPAVVPPGWPDPALGSASIRREPGRSVTGGASFRDAVAPAAAHASTPDPLIPRFPATLLCASPNHPEQLGRRRLC